MERLKNAIFWAVLVSETGHIFCCVLPTVVSIISILSGLGLMAGMPTGLLAFHDFMHDWEIPVIVTSAVILAMGWALHAVSLRLDCQDTGCHHGACAPKKNKTSRILWIATALFAMNLTIYMVLHRGHDINSTTATGSAAVEIHDHNLEHDHVH